MSIIVLADLRGKGGFVNKDTVAGGYGSRFEGFSVATRFAQNLRHIFHNVPSIHIGYLTAIYACARHQVIVTRDDKEVQGDVALVLTSLVDYKHEIEWAQKARARGIRVGFFGLPATHKPELFAGAGDFVIKGEPEEAAMRLAAGEELSGDVKSEAFDDLDVLPFPRWDLIKTRRFGYTSRTKLGLTRPADVHQPQLP